MAAVYDKTIIMIDCRCSQRANPFLLSRVICHEHLHPHLHPVNSEIILLVSLTQLHQYVYKQSQNLVLNNRHAGHPRIT